MDKKDLALIATSAAALVGVSIAILKNQETYAYKHNYLIYCEAYAAMERLAVKGLDFMDPEKINDYTREVYKENEFLNIILPQIK